MFNFLKLQTSMETVYKSDALWIRLWNTPDMPYAATLTISFTKQNWERQMVLANWKY